MRDSRSSISIWYNTCAAHQQCDYRATLKPAFILLQPPDPRYTVGTEMMTLPASYMHARTMPGKPTPLPACLPPSQPNLKSTHPPNLPSDSTPTISTVPGKKSLENFVPVQGPMGAKTLSTPTNSNISKYIATIHVRQPCARQRRVQHTTSLARFTLFGRVGASTQSVEPGPGCSEHRCSLRNTVWSNVSARLLYNLHFTRLGLHLGTNSQNTYNL